MKEGWEYKTLGEVCKIYNGNSINADYKKKHFLGATGGLPFIATKDVSPLGTIDYNNGVRIPNYEEYKVAPANSVFICAEGGSAGKKFAYVEKDVCFGNKLFCITPKDKAIKGKFIYHFVQSDNFKGQFFSLLTGLIGGVSAKKFQTIVIPVPSLSEQQSIVDYLDSAFAKIDAMKANAEKALNEAKALFQASLKEMLEPKEGWEEKTLKDVSVIYGNYGLSVPSAEYNGVRYLRITDITEWGDLNDEKVSAKLDEEKEQELLEEGDILFARTGATVGKTLMYKEAFGKCLFAGYLIRYRINKEIVLPKFIFYITHSANYYKWVLENQKAAAQPNISAKLYNEYVLSFPSLSEQQTIVDTLDSLKSKVDKLQENYNKISQECDALKQAILRQVFE